MYVIWNVHEINTDLWWSDECIFLFITMFLETINVVRPTWEMCDIIVQYELLRYIYIYLNYASLLVKVQGVFTCVFSQNMRHMMAVYASQPSYIALSL